MSLAKCFASAFRMGVITKEEAQAFTKRYNQLLGDGLSTDAAQKQMAFELEAEAAHRKRAALIGEVKRERLWNAVTTYRDHLGRSNLAEAFVRLHENYGHGGSYILDATGLQDTIVREAHRELGQLLTEFKRGAITGDRRRQGKWVGNKMVQARMDNFVREMHGVKTDDDAARGLAASVATVLDKLRIRFNEAGGAIGKLDHYLPQHHNPEALLNVGESAWVETLMTGGGLERGYLDRAKMVHPMTKQPLSDSDLREALSVAYRRITSDGASDMDVEPGAGGGRPALYKQHAEHRFLHFKNAEAWMRYQKDFGAPDVFATIMAHVNMMARDIAQMEVFGPNPNQTREWIKTKLKAEAGAVRTFSTIRREKAEELRDHLDRLKAHRSIDPKRNGWWYATNAQMMNDIVAMETRIETLKADIEQLRQDESVQTLSHEKQVFKLEGELAALWSKYKLWLDKNPPTIPDAIIDAPQDIRTSVARVGELTDELLELPPGIADGVKPLDALDYLNGRLYRADAMWDLMRGASPVNAKWAKRLSATRNVVTASSLGAAWISSLADVAFGKDMRRRIGMGIGQSSAWRLSFLTLKEMITHGSRDDAVAAGFGLDWAINAMQQQSRLTGSIDMRQTSGYLADRVLTVGMLQPWTQAGKHMAGMDLMRWLGKLRQFEFEDLPSGLQNALNRHGFDAGGWEQLRAVPLHERHLRRVEVETALGRDMAEKYHMMLLREIRGAVPEATVESRSVVTSQAAGTLMGEMVRSSGQFKGYAVAIIFLQMRKIARDLQAGQPNAYYHAGSWLLTATILGAVAMALKDMKDGRDPRRWLDEKTWLDPKMWGAAMLQAGGLGIYGDLLFASHNRVGGSFADTLKGPLWDRAETAWQLTGGAVHKAAKGEKINYGRQVVKGARQWTPGGNLWQPNLIPYVAPRVLFEQLEILIDPDARRAFRTDMVKRKQDYGQEYFWRRGELAPHRAPDLSRILSTR